jgi:hypothetical protein
MKKFLLTSLIAVCSVINSEAQEKYKSETLQFGVKAGANYSNVYNSKGEEFVADPKLGFAGGVFLSIPIGRYIGIQPEVLYSQRGFKANGRILNNSYNFTRTSNYLDIPVLFAVKPVEFISILAGPQVSFLLSQKDEFGSSVNSYVQEQEFKNDNIRKNTICLLIGLDINIDHVVIGARAGWDVQNNRGDGSSVTPQYKNAWYQATLGYRF